MTILLATTLAMASAVAHGPYPRVEAYRLCGVRTAARLARERPADAPDVLARHATMQCDPLLGAAVDESLTKAGLVQGHAQAAADFRQRSIADLAHRITTLRASRK